MADKKWKSHLLSSSLPLEHEAARLLDQDGWFLRSDYTYARDDSGVVKDFSVDLEAARYAPFTNPSKIDLEYHLLVECKYRKRAVAWLFLPEPNTGEYSPIWGSVIRAVDQFSPKFLDRTPVYRFEDGLSVCYKGTEIDLSSQTVHDAELKHGIAQLQYALPRLLTETISAAATSHPEDNHPFTFIPVLLTTAPLFVARTNFSISLVEKANEITDIATPVPYLIYFADYGPDFEAHARRECKSLQRVADNERMLTISKSREALGEDSFSLPMAVAKSLVTGQRYQYLQYFTQFIVCSLDSFQNLLAAIRRAKPRVLRRPKSRV